MVAKSESQGIGCFRVGSESDSLEHKELESDKNSDFENPPYGFLLLVNIL